MRQRTSCVFFLIGVVATSAKEKTPIPAVVKNATYVMVKTYSGDSLNPEVTPEDR